VSAAASAAALTNEHDDGRQSIGASTSGSSTAGNVARTGLAPLLDRPTADGHRLETGKVRALDRLVAEQRPQRPPQAALALTPIASASGPEQRVAALPSARTAPALLAVLPAA
jgi:hypothetical protein